MTFTSFGPGTNPSALRADGADFVGIDSVRPENGAMALTVWATPPKVVLTDVTLNGQIADLLIAGHEEALEGTCLTDTPGWYLVQVHVTDQSGNQGIRILCVDPSRPGRPYGGPSEMITLLASDDYGKTWFVLADIDAVFCSVLANRQLIRDFQDMLPRFAQATVLHRLSAYPAVALVGARQAGKTTLARSLGGAYYDLEQPGDRTRLDARWDAVVTGADLVILDEAQTWPDVFPRLRGAIDSQPSRAGRFLLLGSVSPALMAQVSESLAGRLSVVELPPLVLGELDGGHVDQLWLRGGLPAGSVLHGKRFPQWQRDYLTLLAQRDLPAWGLPARPQQTSRLMSMLAAVNGQAWNATQVGSSLGVTHTTVDSYLDYLEGAFLVRRLHAYRANLRKRLMKTPKLMWRDTGLLHAELGVTSLDDLLRRPWVGASWEAFVLNQVLDTLTSMGAAVEAHYFRTSDQYEIDLILTQGDVRWGIEVKLTSSPSPEDSDRLRRAADMASCHRAILACRVAAAIEGPDLTIAALPAVLHLVCEHFA